MSYQPRDESLGLHHVVARGNNKRAIYLDDLDRLVFCLRVDRISRLCGWRILAYVLMRNHYHLLISVGDEGISDGMCRLNTGHALMFNTRHERINHLFGRRYWNRRLTTDASVRNAARYIVQNPVRAGGRLPLEQYEWSSYAPTVGIGFPKMKLAIDELLPFFGARPRTAIAEYRDFCDQLPSPGELDETRLVAATVT